MTDNMRERGSRTQENGKILEPIERGLVKQTNNKILNGVNLEAIELSHHSSKIKQ